MTMAPYSFELDAAALDTFSANSVDTVRVPTAAGPFDWTPNAGLKKRLVAIASCFKSKATAAPAATS